MFQPFTLFLATRYLSAKRCSGFISFISGAAVLGMALGVMVLITVLSVMNGFDEVIRTRFFGMARQSTVTFLDTEAAARWREGMAFLKTKPRVLASGPFVATQAMLTHGRLIRGAYVTGIRPEDEAHLSALPQKMIEGRLDTLKPGHFRIVLGKRLAESLGTAVGDKILMMVPVGSVSPMGFLPRFRELTVGGIFEAGHGFGLDSGLAFMALHDAQALLQMGDQVTGLNIRLQDLYEAPAFSRHLQEERWSDGWSVSDWTHYYGDLFKAIQLEKNMMFLLLLLLIGIAAFNLVASLVMLVNDKRSDIAILRSMGATRSSILTIFVMQGFLVAFIGIVLGTAGGVILSMHVTEVADALQRLCGVQLLSSDVYYVNYLPSKIVTMDVIQVVLSAACISLLATLYPAFLASRTHPAEALRYD